MLKLPTSWRSILIQVLSSHLRLGLPSGPLSFRFPYQNPEYTSLSPIRVTCPAHLILFALITLFWNNLLFTGCTVLIYNRFQKKNRENVSSCLFYFYVDNSFPCSCILIFLLSPSSATVRRSIFLQCMFPLPRRQTYISKRLSKW